MLIRAEAEGTETFELNRNLVLTDGARADSVPNLEIETGEIVGAGHASATGRFDDEQLFYLQSRGIPADEARRLVVRGFFADVINQIGIPEVQERLLAQVEAGARGGGPLVADFQRVCAVSDVPDGGAIRVMRRRQSRSRSCAATATIYAIHDVCSHAERRPLRGRDRGHDHRVLAARLALRPGAPAGRPACPPPSPYPSTR